MEYTKIFDPAAPARRRRLPAPAATLGGDTRDGLVYVWTDEIVLAVNVALATARPLLVCGPPGAGKSSLAPNVARILGWRYLPEFVTSRTQARDLLYRFDALRRLRDAQANDLKGDSAYILPGVLWQAFDPESAAAHGDPELGTEPAPAGEPAVVLLDEIDKADPDVPNSLLEALGTLHFVVDETGFAVTARGTRPPLVIVTTNDERELSKPFLRRCVILTLPAPGEKELAKIASEHGLSDRRRLHVRIASRVVELRQEAAGREAAGPSTAEYLDALRACRTLEVTPDEDAWAAIERATLQKRMEPIPTAS